MNNNLKNRPLALVILDGWGHSDESEGNAIALARTPYYDDICAKYPRTTLAAAGNRVGLANGVAGNSEVGHLNIGAGRVVQTNPLRINEAIRSGTFFENQVLRNAFEHAASEAGQVHLIGMLSDGDVHSSTETLYALPGWRRKRVCRTYSFTRSSTAVTFRREQLISTSRLSK